MQRSECVLQGADSASKLHQKDADSHSTLTGRSVHTSWEYVEYNRLPAFLHDNEFLMRRHRPQLNSVAECLKSAFMLHSETWNIWTHVFGMVCLITIQAVCFVYVALDIHMVCLCCEECIFTQKVDRCSSFTTHSNKGILYSITKRRVPELIPVLGSQPASDVSHRPGGRLPLLSARPAVTPARGMLPVLLLGEERHNGCEQFA